MNKFVFLLISIFFGFAIASLIENNSTKPDGLVKQANGVLVLYEGNCPDCQVFAIRICMNSETSDVFYIYVLEYCLHPRLGFES